MAAERIIGVDFGTSTSVIRVKRYQDGKPVGGRLEVKPVKFNSGASEIVPTLIGKLSTGGEYYGYEAESGPRNAKTFQNFKVDIESPDEDVRRQARELTAEFFKYLGNTYIDQRSFLGEPDDRLRTIISYPVKWSDEARDFLVQTAKDAGFPNVEGVDEAQAAIQAVTVQNADLEYFQESVPINILLIDMGAGTTDLVLCRHTPGTQPQTDTLCTWPKGGNALFGGREVDELLKSYISQAIPKDIADQVLSGIGIDKYKAWKEKTVSPALKKGEAVDYFSELDKFLDVMDIEAEYSVNRDSFEDFAADYLRQFPELVNGCMSAAGLSGDDVDLVILTGGHSQWYFAREMLNGKLDRFGEIALGKIQTDPERIISITLPHETVALGLAYMPLKVETLVEPQPVKAAQAAKPAQEDVFPLKYDPYSRIRPVIACGLCHILGLKKDETVISGGENQNGECNVSNWRNIVAIAARWKGTVGLRYDGTVVAVGDNKYGQCNVGSLRDIVAITVGDDHTVGLKKDGTVVAVGNNTYGQCNVSDWRDIVAISTTSRHTVGLKKDGTVIAIGDNSFGQCNVSDWWDIVAIAAGGYHTVGLKKDGTVIAIGLNEVGQCNVRGWQDVVAIAAGNEETAGLNKDGTLFVAGYCYKYAQTSTGQSWKLF